MQTYITRLNRMATRRFFTKCNFGACLKKSALNFKVRDFEYIEMIFISDVLRVVMARAKINLIPCCNLTTLNEISLVTGFIRFLLSSIGKLEATFLIVTT